MADHLQQTAAGVMVLFVDLQVLGQVGDALGQYRDLDCSFCIISDISPL